MCGRFSITSTACRPSALTHFRTFTPILAALDFGRPFIALSGACSLSVISPEAAITTASAAIELAPRGHSIVEEPGRRIIAEARNGGGRTLPWFDAAAFNCRALKFSTAGLARPVD